MRVRYVGPRPHEIRVHRLDKMVVHSSVLTDDQAERLSITETRNSADADGCERLEEAERQRRRKWTSTSYQRRPCSPVLRSAVQPAQLEEREVPGRKERRR